MQLSFKGLVDTHCHLNDKEFDELRGELVEDALAYGLECIIDVAVDLNSSRKAINNAKNFPVIKACIGLDPEVFLPGSNLNQAVDISVVREELEKLINAHSDFVWGLGETGVDNYWLQQDQNLSVHEKESILKKQTDLFQMHLELGQQYELPLSVHSRGAEERCVNTIQKYPRAFGIFHSFTGSYDVARKLLNSGWGIGVNGIITYKSAQEVREMVGKILGNVSSDWSPEDFYKRGVYFETDAPYLIPRGFRSKYKFNTPSATKSVFEFMTSGFVVGL